MSNFGEAGNGEQINKTSDEYGNSPIQHTGGNTGGAYGTPTGGEYETGNKGHGQGGILHRSKSSSSSSSEDDGQGGRRKKSIKEKIKEKLPGGNKNTTGQDEYAKGHGGTTATTPGEGYGSHATTTTTHDAYGTEPEKKGIVEKIKEKLPGNHQQ